MAVNTGLQGEFGGKRSGWLGVTMLVYMLPWLDKTVIPSLVLGDPPRHYWEQGESKSVDVWGSLWTRLVFAKKHWSIHEGLLLHHLLY